MTANLQMLQRQTVAILGAAFFTVMLVVASTPNVPLA
jgi:hypothetical protein